MPGMQKQLFDLVSDYQWYAGYEKTGCLIIGFVIMTIMTTPSLGPAALPAGSGIDIRRHGVVHGCRIPLQLACADLIQMLCMYSCVRPHSSALGTGRGKGSGY